ncbi:MAG: efflux RND transporter permease subunit [Candidatus Marinimicrobia bacterium]|nr:efflux RND transporter permease subunit [Candidatus Neomarinimicrobiota bacterium]MBL7010917.1 efflux RND transporter permease subunit [Candidatus Neomarinimicrobiota bacterium]MBL7031353.1 efflux RND transporter permease subunit [Candidatus Neomarinimicrobiota bacterium]
MLNKLIHYCLNNKLVVGIFLIAMVVWGLMVAPFDWKMGALPRDPIPVDAIPDIGENQQIVFTKWSGRSPQDIEDQITYPLTTALLGIPDVKTVRSFSMFGFSTIYVIFNEQVEFYWSRSRILEKLNSLPSGTLPKEVQPTLGPDATALGQVFWYTLEGQDSEGNTTGGWDLQELRSIQDWTVRYALQSASGVSEVASIGGFVKEYQIDVNPLAMREHGIQLTDVFNAVRQSNLDVGARTIEVNRVEYMVRGLGFIKSMEDIEYTVVKTQNNVPIYIKDVAHVALGPALRRGVLDKEGAEAVGGVVVARYGENPLATIKSVKEKIKEIAPGLPKKTLSDGTESQVTVVPFYDRTGLIYETLGTLNHALRDEILITIIVILVMVMHFRTSLLISSMLPLTVLMVFIGMKLFKVDANIVALSGIAIAIGTIVDMGIVVTENILKHLDKAKGKTKEVIFNAVSEVSGAVVTAVSTTVISFLPVFTMIGAEGKLFKPLAYTKTFALVSSVIIALTVLPVMANLLLGRKKKLFSIKVPEIFKRIPWLGNGLVISMVVIILAFTWAPMGLQKGFFLNVLFAALIIAGIMGSVTAFTRVYPNMLRWALNHKKKALSLPAFVTALGLVIWLGFDAFTGWVPNFIRSSRPMVAMGHIFPGLGKEFMPPLDEGSFLYMPTTMPHAGMEESIDVLQTLDKALYSVPEVESVVGKIGRVDSPLDPAPLSMVESIVAYKPEYGVDANGKIIRLWRDHIRSSDDIWDELVKAAQIPGTTSAPKLQPISARLVMLQSGMRAPMGIKVKGPDLKTIESFGLALEKHMKNAPGVKADMVFADRIVGKPYLEIEIDRRATARYGIALKQVQHAIEVAVGGMPITTTVEGRERYPVRVRYMREFRDKIESLEKILIPAQGGAQIPLIQLAEINYVRGPQVIKSEDTFKMGYVLFDKQNEWAEVDVVESAQDHLNALIESGELNVPNGVSYTFAGSYENQIRASKKLAVVLPLALAIIFLILYFQFKRVSTTLIVFSGIFVAWSGGFVMLWLYGQDWFLNFNLFGENMRNLFQMHPVNLSVAVWVGFLALFGIASDNGVIISTYLDQSFKQRKPNSIKDVREAVVFAGERRIRPAMMTAATTILALIPVLMSTGRGADVMVPMAIPSFGGMVFAILTTFVVPIIYSFFREKELK